ncbi:Na/Pi cotransporter family protein [Paradevosia shaoguanensis]|uniref:Na/Pi cotransporter family protein n=1 Tax=Paradevosia shaoguanensis TaxID=1335043 RepID=UPI0019312A5A|nr:Na/Pi cotransporter family protein [Paradevosia shaoguanensis]
MYLTVVHLVAAIVLLIWAVRMVRTAVERSYSTQLRRVLNFASSSKLAAAVSGATMAIALQSSTAAALLAIGFAGSGLMTSATGIAVQLGAALGSALVASILSMDLSWLTPLLVILGGLLFFKGNARQTKQLGRLVMGLAFTLISLQMMSEATAAWRDSPVLEMGVTYLRNDLITAFLLAALLGWAIHSSVAAVLLIASFSTHGLIPVEMAAALVLGVNTGGAFITVLLTRAMDVRARRIALGNMLFQVVVAVALLLVLQFIRPPLNWVTALPGSDVIAFHVAFNLLRVAVCLPFTGQMARLTERLLKPAPNETMDVARLRQPALIREAKANPDIALASATRELLRMSELVEVMLQPVMNIYQTGDKVAIKQIKELEAEVNKANSDIKLYLASLDWDGMDEGQKRRGQELTSFAINMEQAGDIVAKQLLKLAEQKCERNIKFSDQGWKELTDLHARVLDNLQLSLNVLVSEDRDSARQLIEEKDEIGAFERESIARHLTRLRSGTAASRESSDLHLETVHALKRINSALSGIAYSILSESGDLLDSRLSKAAGAP